MKRNEKKELHDMSQEELIKRLHEVKKEYFDLRMEKEQGRLKNTSNLTLLRKKIAVAKTFLKEKEGIEHA